MMFKIELHIDAVNSVIAHRAVAAAVAAAHEEVKDAGSVEIPEGAAWREWMLVNEEASL